MIVATLDRMHSERGGEWVEVCVIDGLCGLLHECSCCERNTHRRNGMQAYKVDT